MKLIRKFRFSGCTGPVLLYDEALFGFTKANDVEFLPFRVWIGIWVLIISIVVAGFQGSYLVKFFTKFTKDIFASLVALLFIFEAIKKVVLIFNEHPLMSLETYCNASFHHHIDSLLLNNQSELGSPLSLANQRDADGMTLFDEDMLKEARIKDSAEPNTALLSAILMFGTFFIAYFLRIFRNGKYLGRTVSGGKKGGKFGEIIFLSFLLPSRSVVLSATSEFPSPS